MTGDGRVELSGATTANWVAKSANLLVDGFGTPDRVGLLLPLHWQTVVLLLAGAATGATVVLAAGPGELAGCPVAFVLAEHAPAALTAGVDDVLAVSGSPMGGPAGRLPDLVLDYGREVPGYGDRFAATGVPGRVRLEVAGEGVGPAPELGLTGADRVLTVLDPTAPGGLDRGLLAPLAAGAALVLVPRPAEVDLPAVAVAEGVTATVGADLPGCRRLD